MEPTRKIQYWILMFFFFLVFAAGGIGLYVSVSAADSVFVVPIFAGIFLLTAAFYLSPAYPWYRRLSVASTIAAILLHVLPALLLHMWMGLVRDYWIAPIAWFAPFMGMGVGLNLRMILGKEPS